MIRFDNEVFRFDAAYFTSYQSYNLIFGDAIAIRAYPTVLSKRLIAKSDGPDSVYVNVIAEDNSIPTIINHARPQLKHNSHIDFGYLVLNPSEVYVSNEKNSDSEWRLSNSYSYVRIARGVQVQEVEDNMNDYLRTIVPRMYSIHEWNGGQARITLRHVRELSKIRTIQDDPSIKAHSVLGASLYIYSVLLQIVASALYMLFLWHRNLLKFKSFAIRIVYGASKSNIARLLLLSFSVQAGQFILAGILVVSILAISGTYGNSVGGHLALSALLFCAIVFALLSIGFLMSYVTFKNASLRTAATQSLSSTKRTNEIGIQLILAVCSVVLVSSSLLLNKHMNQLLQPDYGFEVENLAGIDVTASERGFLSEIKQKLLTSSLIVSSSDVFVPYPGSDFPKMLQPLKEEPIFSDYPSTLMVSEGFFDVLDIEILSGSVNSGSNLDDFVPVILNRKAVEVEGESINTILGREYKCCFAGSPRVTAIVEDFKFQYLDAPITPLAILLMDANPIQIIVKTSRPVTSEVIREIQSLIQSVTKIAPSVYSIESAYAKPYRKIIEAKVFVAVMSLFSVILCMVMGHFGARATITANLKNLAIRRYCGATTLENVKTLMRPLLVPNVIAFIVSLVVLIAWNEKWSSQFGSQVPELWLMVVGVELCPKVVYGRFRQRVVLM